MRVIFTEGDVVAYVFKICVIEENCSGTGQVHTRFQERDIPSTCVENPDGLFGSGLKFFFDGG
jgi:hypothetical protein